MCLPRIPKLVPLEKFVTMLEENNQNLVQLDDLFPGRPSYVHTNVSFILDILFGVCENWILYLEAMPRFGAQLLLLSTVSIVQIKHVERIGIFFEDQHKEVIRVCNIGITNMDMLIFLGYLDVVNQALFEPIKKKEVVADSCKGDVWPVDTSGSQRGSHQLDLFLNNILKLHCL